jgi:hypothetical protein
MILFAFSVRACLAVTLIKWMPVHSVLASFDPDEHDQYYGYNCKVGIDASPDGRAWMACSRMFVMG